MIFNKDQIVNNRYKILDLLGSGGMGTTYLIHDSINNQKQVLKILHLNDSVSIESFKQEFSILAKLKHPNLVNVFEFGIADGKECYYTMEVIDGVSIKEYFENNPIDKGNFLNFYQILIQVFLALDYIHSRKILHGDLKPDNIFISIDKDSNPRPKILDFGLSENFDISLKGDFKGTAEYMAPEKIKGERIDGRSDLYSFGMIVYELLCGSLPFKYDDLLSLLKKHLYEEVTYIDTKFNLPEDFKKIILRLLRKQKSDRYFFGYEVAQSISELDKENLIIESKDISESYITSSNFIGRKEELEKLYSLYNSSSVKSEFIVLSGETGIGKTRLIKEFKVRVQIEGGSIIDIKCNDKITQPYLPVLNIINQISAMLEGDKLLEESNDLLNFTDSTLSGKIIEKPEQTLEKENLILSMVDFLIKAGKKVPFVIYIDDFENADSGTLEFIKYFSGNLSVQKSNNILFCIIYQSDSGSDVASLVDDLTGNEQITKLELKGINKQEINDYVISSLGLNEVPQSLIELIERDTNGNLYFIEEILKGLLSEGFLYRKQGAWNFKPGYESLKFPSSVAEIHHKRIERFSGPDREFLYSLSVFPDRFDRKDLNKITNISYEELQVKLGKFIDEDILVIEKNLYSFKNQKIRDILYSELNPENKKTIHALLVNYYDQLYFDCKDKYSELFAYHLFNAERYDEALPLLIRLADRSKFVFANLEAVTY
jgi:serine/threonine protein kinase